MEGLQGTTLKKRCYYRNDELLTEYWKGRIHWGTHRIRVAEESVENSFDTLYRQWHSAWVASLIAGYEAFRQDLLLTRLELNSSIE